MIVTEHNLILFGLSITVKAAAWFGWRTPTQFSQLHSRAGELSSTLQSRVFRGRFRFCLDAEIVFHGYGSAPFANLDFCLVAIRSRR